MKYAFIYGALSGAAIMITMIAGLVLSEQGSFFSSAWFGYLVMLVALTFVFAGVKRYRDVERGGVIKFLPAFGLGLSIAVVAGIAYALVWEVYLARTGYVFMDEYIAGIARQLKADGTPAEVIAKKMAELEPYRVYYRNPLFRLPMTFMEMFPVGLLVALVSAALLRNPRLLPATR